jgi:hypothetical protein
MVWNTVECTAAHIALAAADSLYHHPSSMSHYFLCHCSSADLYSVGTSMLECTSYTEIVETDVEAAMLATRNTKSIIKHTVMYNRVLCD